MGSTRYVAPEILNKRPYDIKVDIWSATIVIFVLLTGKMPYNGKDFNQMKKLIEQNELDLNSEKYDFLSAEAKSFLKQGLEKNHHRRATALEMIEHPWLTDIQIPKTIHFKTNNVALTIFLLRSGHLIA